MRRGWFRLWVVISVFAVPAGAVWMTSFDRRLWSEQFDVHWRFCDGNHEQLRETMDQCLHEFGADKDIYQQEHTTPARYWGMALVVSFLADLMLTALVVGAFLVVRWVIRGFANGPSTSIEDWWGRTFEGRGKVDFENFNESVVGLQQMSTENVATHSLSKGFGGILAGMELRRRENWTGRAALVVSIFALIVAAASAIVGMLRH